MWCYEHRFLSRKLSMKSYWIPSPENWEIDSKILDSETKSNKLYALTKFSVTFSETILVTYLGNNGQKHFHPIYTLQQFDNMFSKCYRTFPKNKEFWRENYGGKLISMDDLTRRCTVGASATILSVLIERRQWRQDEKSVDKALDIYERVAWGLPLPPEGIDGLSDRPSYRNFLRMDEAAFDELIQKFVLVIFGCDILKISIPLPNWNQFLNLTQKPILGGCHVVYTSMTSDTSCDFWLVPDWIKLGNIINIWTTYTTQNLLRITFSFNDLMLKTNRLKKDFFIKIG